MRQHILARGFGCLAGEIDVAWPVLAMLYDILRSEYPEHRSNRRIRGRIWKFGHDFGNRCAPSPVKDVHYLALSTGGRGRFGFGCHHRIVGTEFMLKNQPC